MCKTYPQNRMKIPRYVGPNFGTLVKCGFKRIEVGSKRLDELEEWLRHWDRASWTAGAMWAMCNLDNWFCLFSLFFVLWLWLIMCFWILNLWLMLYKNKVGPSKMFDCHGQERRGELDKGQVLRALCEVQYAAVIWGFLRSAWRLIIFNHG